MREYLSLLEINQCKLTDHLLIYWDVVTPFDPMLYIYDKDDTLLDTRVYDFEENNTLYWNVEIDEVIFAKQTNYKLVLDDELLTGFDDQTYLLYVNDDLDAEDYITRALGLSGHNCRYYNYTWTSGQITGFNIRFYSTLAALVAAEAGTSDVPIATYTVSIYYDENYNPYKIASIRSS